MALPKWIKIGMVAVCIGVLIAVALTLAVRSAGTTAEDFLEAGFERNYQSAHAMLSEPLRREVSIDALAQIFAQGRLTGAQSIEWMRTGLDGLQANLHGVITDRRSNPSEWKVVLDLEGASWGVVELAPLEHDTLERLVPSPELLFEKTRELADSLAAARASGNFEDFLSYWAPKARAQFDLQALKDQYAAPGSALDELLAAQEFRLTRAVLDNDGVLRVEADLGAQSSPDLIFSFFWEFAAWRLIGLKIRQP